MSSYVVQRTSVTGTVQATLAFAVVDFVDDRGNEGRTARVRFPCSEYTTSDLNTFDFLIIYRNGNVIFRGLALDPMVDSRTNEVAFECVDFLWVLNRLQLDSPKENMLTNGDFATGTTSGWTVDSGVTANVISSGFSDSGFVVQLVQPDAWADRGIVQNVTVTTGVDTKNVTLSAYFRVPNPITLVNLTYESRGLYMQVRESGRLIRQEKVELSTSLDTDVWLRFDNLFHQVPPNVTQTISVKGYAPQGTSYWSSFALTRPQPFVNTTAGSGSVEDDVGAIVDQAVTRLQQPSRGKFNLHLLTNCPNTGETERVFLERFQHRPFTEFMAEWLSLADQWISFTPTTQTYHFASRGDDQTGNDPLVWPAALADEPGAIAAYRRSTNGSGVVSDQVMLSEGDGPDREEFQAVDTTHTGGLVFQNTATAQAGSTLRSVRRQARALLRQRKRPLRTYELTLQDPDHVAGMGDMWHVTIDNGWDQLDADRKIIRRYRDGLTDLVTVTVHDDLVA